MLITDENRFNLSRSDGRVTVWRSTGERYQAWNIVQHDRFSGGSVMVWGGISLEGRTDLYVLNRGKLTVARYRDEILRPIVRPFGGVVGPGFLLVHDNARPHVARVCQRFFEDEGIDTIDWLARCPDLNPIEHPWNIMDQRIWRLPNPPRTVQELTNVLIEVWQDIDLGTGSTLYSEGSFVRRFFCPKPFEVAMLRRTYGPKVLYSDVPLLRKLLCSEDSIFRKAPHYMDSMLRRFFSPKFI